MSTNQRYLGHYELQQPLESDATGESWRAFDTQQHRYVALKIQHVNSQAVSDAVPRVLSESQTLTSLRHPNIAQILDVQPLQDSGSSATGIYIVTDYVEGQSLASYIDATAHKGKIPTAEEIVRLLAPIASAIDYAHQRGIIHGAISPRNIILDKHNTVDNALGEPKLIGFGMNTLQVPLTLSLNEVFYISPEQVQGYTENARSDIYSLGIILYEMCTGTLPFQGDTPTDIMMQHMHATPTSPALINPHLLPVLTAVIMRSIAKDPVARFPTASAMTVAIARALNLSAQDILSQSGSRVGVVMQPMSTSQADSPADPMHGPTYLSPLPQHQQARIVRPGQQITGGNLSPLPKAPSVASLAPALPAASGHMPTVANGSSGAMPALYPAPQHVQQPPFAQPTEKRRRRGLYAIIAAILAIIVLSSVVVGYLLYTRQITPTSPIVGHAFFVSSGQVDLNSSQGIADRLQVDVTLPAPQANKSYYFWLKSDNDARTDALPILLGTSSNGGAIHISYPGDAQHSDLLANYSRFLITEENAGTAPTNPSIDTNTWRYSAAFSQQPNPEDTVNHFSQLDHLRHLLAQDPKLKLVGLTGGLDIWLFRNTLKILEAAGSARDAYQGGDAALIQRQLIRILDYLDGSQYVQTEHLPPGLPPVLIDPTIARVALLEIDVQNQTPPGYLKHIGSHLAELTQVPGVTPAQKALAIQINNDINNVQGWLENVHRDAEKLIQMTPAQLQQPQALTILDDLFTQANNAFVGQTDPNTNQVREGVVQIHYNIQRLATFDLRPWQAS